MSFRLCRARFGRLPPTAGRAMPAERSVSQMSSATALPLDELQFDPLLELSLIADDEVIPGQYLDNGGRAFLVDKVKFIVTQAKDERGTRRLQLTAKCTMDAEWKYMAQLRIKTGSQEATVMRVVDKDIFSFGSYTRPVKVDITEPRVNQICFEMRFVNKICIPLPTFSEGDVTVVFGEGDPIRVHSSLLALVSDYMKSAVSQLVSQPDAVLDVSPFPRHQFIEMLYHIYPVGHFRPLWADFKGLVNASIAFKVRPLEYRLSKHLTDYGMPFLDKIDECIKLELTSALEELVYSSAKRGYWSHLISAGWDPEAHCGSTVYNKIVLPTLLKAKLETAEEKERRSVLVKPDYSRDLLIPPSDEEKPHTVTVLCLGSKFYVNKGVLAAHGDSQFGRNNQGELICNVSWNFRNICIRSQVSPGEVIEALFLSLYPFGKEVTPRYTRCALVFALDHSMTIAASILEQQLMLEPPVNAAMLYDHFFLSEKYGLENMMRNSLHLAEGSAHDIARYLASLPEFATLSQSTRDAITKRLCCGWALATDFLTRKTPTSFVHRRVDLEEGGTIEQHRMNAFATFREDINSDLAFGSTHPEALRKIA